MHKLQNVSEARYSFLQPNCRNDVSWQSFKSNLCYSCNKTMLYITNSPSRVITRALWLRCTKTCTICMYHPMTRIQMLCYCYYCLLLFKYLPFYQKSTVKVQWGWNFIFFPLEWSQLSYNSAQMYLMHIVQFYHDSQWHDAITHVWRLYCLWMTVHNWNCMHTVGSSTQQHCTAIWEWK